VQCVRGHSVQPLPNHYVLLFVCQMITFDSFELERLSLVDQYEAGGQEVMLLQLTPLTRQKNATTPWFSG